MPTPLTKLWLPESHADKALVSLNRAVREYDERLRFMRNEVNGDWVVAMLMPHGEAPIPVLGFGFELPDPAEVLKKMHEIDTKQHGDQILESIWKNNEQLKAAAAARAEDGEWRYAEGLEFLMRRDGQTPYMKSLRKRDPKQRG